MEVNELEILWNNARINLSNAQLKCRHCHQELSTLRARLVKSQRIRSTMIFMIHCLKSQSVFLHEIILKKNIHDKLIEKEWRQIVLTELVGQLKHWQEQITMSVEKLNKTSYDLSNSDGNKTLSDFISRDNLSMLEEKLKEVPEVEHQIGNIKLHYQSLEGKIKNNIIGVKISKLESKFKECFGLDNEKFLPIDSYFQEIEELEGDLVDFLKSFTDHFDKCSILKQNSLPTLEQYELLEIVKKDDLELKMIMLSLQETIDDSKDLSITINDRLNEKTEAKESLKLDIRKVLNELQKIEEYLTVFHNISNLLQAFKDSCIQDMQKVRDLCEFYDNFLLSYQSLLYEIERRRNVTVQMEKIIKKCENQLHELHLEDIRQRQLYLVKNGDYLPETIWPGEIDDISPLYKLSYSIKKI